MATQHNKLDDNVNHLSNRNQHEDKEAVPRRKEEIPKCKDTRVYIQIHRAILFLVRTLINPNLERIILDWYQEIKIQCKPCATPLKCPPHCKPRVSKGHCQNCIDWVSTLERVFYSTDKKGSLQWENVNSSLFYTNPVEVLKVFLPQQDEELNSLSLDGFDIDICLRFLYNFTPFHRGDEDTVALIKEMINIRNLMLQQKGDDIPCLYEPILTKCFIKTGNLISCLLRIHPNIFTQKMELDFNKIKKEDFEIKREHLKIDSQIGSGPYKKATLTKSTGEKIDVVVKIVRSVDKDRLGLMKSLQHSNLIRCIGVCEDVHDTIIVDEWASHGDLRSYLDKCPRLPINLAKKWAIEVCSVIEYLHKVGCVHTDIRSSNVLIMSDDTLKLSDFESVKGWDQTKSARGLHCHPMMPPEVVKDKRRSMLSDVFSLGVVIWEIITTQVPLANTQSKSVFGQIKEVVDGQRPEIPDNCSKLASLLDQCWQENYKQRPKVKDIIPLLDDAIEEYYEAQMTEEVDNETQVPMNSISTSVISAQDDATRQIIVDQCNDEDDNSLSNATTEQKIVDLNEGIMMAGARLRDIGDQLMERSITPVKVTIDVMYSEMIHDPTTVLLVFLGFRNSAVEGTISLVNKTDKRDEAACQRFDAKLYQLLNERDQASHYIIEGSYQDDVRHIQVKPMLLTRLVLALSNAYKRTESGSKPIIHTVNLLNTTCHGSPQKLPNLPEELAYKQSYPETESNMIEYIDSSEQSIMNCFDVGQIQKHVSAFANTCGGRILFGIDDNGIVSGVQCTEDKQELTKKVDDLMKQMHWYLPDQGIIEPRENTHWMIRWIDIGGTPQASHHRVVALTIKPVGGGCVFIEEPQCPLWAPKSTTGYRLMTFKELCQYLKKIHDDQHGRNQDDEGVLETDSAIARPMSSPGLTRDTRENHSKMSPSTTPTSSKSNDTNDVTMTNIPNQGVRIVKTPHQLAIQSYQQNMLKSIKKKPSTDARMVFAVSVKTNGLQFAAESGDFSDASQLKGQVARDDASVPAIRVLNYVGRILIVTLLTTEEGPQCLHPNKLVGPNCQNGLFSRVLRVDTPSQLVRFPSLHIMGVNKKNIGTELEQRKSRLQVLCPDMEFHTIKNEEYDLSRVQLCIIGVIPVEENPNYFSIPLPTLSSICLSDKGKRLLREEPRILEMSECKGPVNGGQELDLQIQRIQPGKYTIVFSVTTMNPPSSWQTLAPVTSSSKQRSMHLVTVSTPSFYKKNITEPTGVKVQVRRSDGSYSNAMLYIYMPRQSKSVSIKAKVDKKKKNFGVHFCCIGAASPNFLEWDENESKMGQERKTTPDSGKQLSYQEIAKRENLRSVIDQLPQAKPDKPAARPKQKSNSAQPAKQTQQRPQKEVKQKNSDENFRKFTAFASTYGYMDTISLVKDVKENFSITEEEAVAEAKSNLPPTGEDRKDEYVSDWVTSTVSATLSDESVSEDEVMKSFHEAEMMKAIAEGNVQPGEESISTTSNDAASNTERGSDESDTGSGSTQINTGSGRSTTGSHSLSSTQGQMEVEYERHLKANDDPDAARDSSLGTIDDVNSGVHDVADAEIGTSGVTTEGIVNQGQFDPPTRVTREGIVNQGESDPPTHQGQSENYLGNQVVDWQEELGKGKYGSVVYQVKLQDGNLAAARQATNPDVAEDDVNTLKKLDHECIMVVYGLIHHNGLLYIVLEYSKYGCLRKYLIDGSLPSNKVRVSLVIQVASGIAYLHRMNIVHGDIGTHNCFLMPDDKLKVRILSLDVNNQQNVDVEMFGNLLCDVLFPQHADSTQNIGASSRQEIPSDCPAGLRALIQTCWGEGSHPLSMEEIQEKLESHASDLDKQNEWKNLDEPKQYENELQDNLNEELRPTFPNEQIKISQEDSGCISSSLLNVHPPAQYSSVIAANSTPESGTFDMGLSNSNSPNATLQAVDLKATITSDYHSSSDPNQDQEPSIDDQGIDSNNHEGERANNLENYSDDWADSIDGSPNSEVMPDTKASSFQQRSTKQSINCKKPDGKNVADCPVALNMEQQTNDAHSLEKIPHHESLPERRGFSHSVITKPQINKSLTKATEARTNIEGSVNTVEEHKITKSNGKRRPPVATRVVDKSGGTIKLEGYGIALSIPPGALQKPEEITLTVVWDDLPQLDEEECNVCPIVRCLPSGLKFDKAVKIRIPHCAVPISDKKMTTRVHCNQKDPDETPDWQNLSDSSDSYPITKMMDDHLLLFVTHFTDYLVKIDGVEWKKVKLVAYASKICKESDQVVHVYVRNDHQAAVQLVKEQQKEFPEMSRTGLSPTYFMKKSNEDLIVKFNLKTVGWLLLSDDQKVMDFFNVWHDAVNSCQFTLKVIKSVERLFCKISAKQESNPRRDAEIEINIQESVTMTTMSSAPACEPTQSGVVMGMTYHHQQQTAQINTNNQHSIQSTTQQGMVMAVSGVPQYNPNLFDSGNLSAISADPTSPFQPLQTPEYPHYQFGLQKQKKPHIPFDLVIEVCNMLDTLNPIGRDYRMLANNHGLSRYIDVFARNKDGPTKAILDVLQSEAVITNIQELIDTVASIPRPDVVQVITEYRENSPLYKRQLSEGSLPSGAQPNAIENGQETHMQAIVNRPEIDHSVNSRNQLSLQHEPRSYTGPQVNQSHGLTYPNLNLQQNCQPNRPTQLASPPAASSPGHLPNTPGCDSARVPEEPALVRTSTPSRGHNQEDVNLLPCDSETPCKTSSGPTNVHPAESTHYDSGELEVDGGLVNDKHNSSITSGSNTNQTLDDSGLDDNSNQVGNSSGELNCADLVEKLDNVSITHSG